MTCFCCEESPADSWGTHPVGYSHLQYEYKVIRLWSVTVKSNDKSYTFPMVQIVSRLTSDLLIGARHEIPGLFYFGATHHHVRTRRI